MTPDGTAQVWGAANKDGSYTVALFNLGSFPARVSADWTSLGFSGKAQVRDVWAQRDIGGRDGGIAATIPAHGAELYRVTPAKHSGTGVTAYEAESPANAAVDGAAPADCADCSGGKKIGNLYNGGALQFRNIRVSRGGTYQVGIRYVSGDLRSATVSANGQSPITLGFPSSGGWDLPATATVPLSLHAGNNTVEIDSSSAVYSPNVDALKVPASPR